MSEPRRNEIRTQIVDQTGIDEAMIEHLVHRFYDRIRDDGVLGPIFTAHITDWEPHLRTMCDFWSSVALMTGRYHGNPMGKHAHLPVDARHFNRWLELFEHTAQTVCPPAAAAHFVERARRIAESLELGISVGHGQILAKGQRFINDDLNI
ncbi:group III truncated hemoglobin [Magnetovibrio blakemorei]|uniref:Preprotein translocase subunit TatC n=1 Tax=Magnetovibrio blakemorei TaxID=28181 RepID=A0A1E5Q5R6_9PROT|nr:group III truncated hemoglobin [Magnetovibrio blakemorei]OEJ65302.1 preprotein translocase subunit TatC [Magnetovibrio blakemorei]